MPSRSETVQLGQHVYELVPQPVPVLRRRLGGRLEQLSDASVDGANIGAFVSEHAYELLSVFIPDLMPRHEWEGFSTREAMDADEFDEQTARRLAPTGPQIRDALELAMKANGLDFYKALGKLVDPTTLRALATRWMVETLSRQSQSSSSTSGPESESTIFSGPQSRTGDDAGSSPTPALSSSPFADL